MANWTKAEQLLEELYFRYGDFQLNKLGTDGAIWDGWKHYSELRDVTKARPTDRQVLANEIVFDCDYEKEDRVGNIERNIEIAEKISDNLDDANIIHSIWRSGGKGVHIHVFIDPDQARLLESGGKLSDFKRWFMRELAAEFEGMNVLDVASAGTHLIQLEWVEHRKGTGDKVPLHGPTAAKRNHMVENDVDYWVDEFLDQDKYEPASNVQASSGDGVDVSALQNDLIEYCLENQVMDGRDRLLFFCTSRLVRTEDHDTVVETVSQISENFGENGPYWSDARIRTAVENAEDNDVYPSYEWIADQLLSSCSDEDLVAFVKNWVQEQDIDVGVSL